MTPLTPLAGARTFLFVPGCRADRFEKAIASGADAVVLDLEDAVSPDEKTAARAAITAAWPSLQSKDVPLVIRINAVGSPWGQEDLRWLSRLQPIPAGVMIPKAEALPELEAVRKHTATPILPLIESAAGYEALNDIARAVGVVRLVIGHLDFMADTGIECGDDEAELNPLRFAVAMATRRSQLAPAVDGVTVAVQDDERLRKDTLRAQRFGFGAKLCIHPGQIDVVHDTLAADPAKLEWARRVLAADEQSGGAATQLDGMMVDLPVVLRARRLLTQHQPAGSPRAPR
jgi:citrate lyase subunit beta/citryl-CoA lyase